ncbi:MAG: hypothetical protein II311_07695, partial [Lachnospiraceae bacterium]|nr:hypothetical protein [Lachnospiraceae bacterium]
MKKINYYISALVLAVMLLVGCTKTDGTMAAVVEIAKHGNLILDITGADLFSQGYEYGDILEVTVTDQTWETPLCSNYSDVDNGMTVLRAASEDAAVVLAINMGDFAATAGIAEKVQIEEEPGYRWDYLTKTPVKVKIMLKQEDGYREQWLIHQLVRTNERADYAHLSDEAFANFRVIDTTGMGENKLYRSSSHPTAQVGAKVTAGDVLGWVTEGIFDNQTMPGHKIMA